jgi:hypothetical protein
VQPGAVLLNKAALADSYDLLTRIKIFLRLFAGFFNFALYLAQQFDT